MTTLLTEKENKILRNDHHQYHHEDYPGELWPGVTTVLGVINKPALIPWARNVALAQVAEEFLTVNPFQGLRTDSSTEAETDRLWRQFVHECIDIAKRRPDQVRDAAANFGTRSHEMIASHLADEDAPIPDDLQPVWESFATWYGTSGLTIQITETTVYSEVHKFGGTVDAVAERDGKLVVMDWKTSSGIYPEMALQVGAYTLALEEMTGSVVSEAWVVRFGKKKPEFEALPLRNLQNAKAGFIHALSLYRTLKEDLI